MNIRELKKNLIQSYQMEQEYHELVVQCLKRIYPDDAETVVYYLEEMLHHYDDMGCLQSLQYFDTRLNKLKKERDDTKSS